MPKRSSNKPDREHDPNVTAFRVVQEATRDPDTGEAEQPVPKKRRKNPAAVALGRRGGKKGGKARAAKLTPEQRSEIARKAARARWKPGSGE